MKRLLSFILALFTLLTTLLSAGCAGRFKNFCDSDLTGYVNISLSDFTGQTVKLSGVYPEITREDAIHELDYYRMFNANSQSGEGIDVYLSKPGLWDVTHIYYDLTATEDGQTVASNLFGEDGTEEAPTGYWMFEDKLDEFANTNGIYHPIFTSKVLSDALLTTQPATRIYFEEGEAFSHSEGAVLYIDYQLSYEDGEVAPKSVKDLRIDTGMRDYYVAKYGEDFFNALLSKENAYGKNFEVATTAKDKNGNDVPATYTVKVKYLSEETFTTVSLTLAEDAFDDTYSDALRALNGKTVYLHFFVHHYVDYVVPELDSKFVTETLGYQPKEGEDEESEIVEGAIAMMTSKLKEKQERAIKEEAMATFMNGFYREELVKKIPKAPYTEQYDYIVSTIESAYIEELNAARENGEDFPYASVHEYAADYTNPKYSLEEFPTLQDYADTLATETVSYRVFVVAMAQLAGKGMSYIALRQEYEAVYEQSAEAFKAQNGFDGTESEIIMVATSGKCTTAEEFEWYILWTIVYGRLTEYIYENNTWQYEKQ